MAVVVRMPSVLAGATEAALARWLVSPGDSVSAGTPLAELETEKALVEYAAEQAGVVGRLLLGEGDTAEIGAPIAVLLAAGETGADIDAALGANGLIAATNGHDAAGRGGRVFASPLVRKLAGERGVDLAGLAGTGPNGRIVRRDLERFLAAPGAPARPAPSGDPLAPARPTLFGDPLAPAGAPSAPATPALTAAGPPLASPAPPFAPSEGAGGGGAEHAPVLDDAGAVRAAGSAAGPAGATLIPHTPMRRAIARRLTESKGGVPHFYLVAECVVDELLALRGRVNEPVFPGKSVPAKVSVNDFVLAAVAAAFGDVPEANVTWTDEGLLAYRSVDISIAVATEGGLVTPVLRGVDSMRLSAIARESAALAARARERKLRQHELEGGTFTVSNLGMYGTAEFSAIINPPQSGILAVGAARKQPVVVDGSLAVATVLRCTLSADHRAIDGALAARWLAAFTARLENPLGALV